MRSVFALLSILIVMGLAGPTIPQPAPRAFVSNERSGTISVIDTSTDRVVDTITTGGRPRGIQRAPDRSRIYVAISDAALQAEGKDEGIIAIDTTTRTRVAKYEAGTDPEQFAVHPDGRKFYISNEDAGTASVTTVASGKVLATCLVGIEPEGVAISPSGRLVYVTAETSNTVSVIDTAKNAVMATVPVGQLPWGVQILD